MKTTSPPMRASAPAQPALATPQIASRLHDFGVLFGRLCPTTKAHVHCIRRMLSVSRRGILQLGSSYQSRSPRVPFFFAEREAMVRGALTADENARLDIVALPDSYNNAVWKTNARSKVAEIVAREGFGRHADIALVGHSKDRTSYYLKMFHPWTSVEVGNYLGISATAVREGYFVHPGMASVVDGDLVPDNVAAFLHDFSATPDYAWLVEEAAWYAEQRAKFEKIGFQVPPPIVTSEAVVIQSGHVLMCERLRRPGKGLLCLPGDKLRGDTFADSVLDTLVKRLGLMVAPTRPERIARQTVKGRVTAVDLFDHPYSSERAHLISQVRLFEFVDDERGLPTIGRGTDTLRPKWMPIEEIDPQTVFEDGWHKLQKMLTRAEER